MGAGLAVILPVKSFRAAKARLAAVLSPDERAHLARWTADRVLRAATIPTPLHTFVACDDPEVAQWATSHGARVLWGPGLGLNGAVDAAAASVADLGYERIMISHADLPLATDFAGLASQYPSDEVVLVPDRFRAGTNLVIRPVQANLPASYGTGSFRAHLALALRSGYRVTVRMDPALGLDLDTPAELHHPAIQPLVASALARSDAAPEAMSAPTPPLAVARRPA